MGRASSLICAVSALVLLLSCSKDNGTAKEEGCLRVSVAFQEEGKASVLPGELKDNCILNIYYADFSGLVRTYRYNELPEKIYMPAGNYRLDVLAGEGAAANPKAASWEGRSYRGSKPFTLTPSEETEVSVEAGVDNAISKIIFDGTIESSFTQGYTLEIGTGKDATLVYDAAKNGKEGYFIVRGLEEPEFSWTFRGTLARDGKELTKSGKITGIQSGRMYSLTIKYTFRDGYFTPEILVNTDIEEISTLIVFDATSTGLDDSESHEIWATHATVHAHVSEKDYPDRSLIGFSCSSDGSNWKEIKAVHNADGKYDGEFTGLTPDTEYRYRLTIGAESIGDEKRFRTQKTEALPNGSFERCWKSGDYYEFYAKGDSPWWGSGNGSEGIQGSADFGAVICAPDTGEKIDGNQSAKLMSQWATVKFAAGNLFCGHFGGIIGTKGGKVFFGRPFTCRPKALKIWLKYSAGKINRKQDGVTISGNDYDKARVIVTIGKWRYQDFGGNAESPFLFDTTKPSTLVDFRKCTGTIAYGEKILESDSSNPHNKWVEYTIALDYSDVRTAPTHIVISCASSMYGDYFTGCDSAVLWMDKAELIY